jgi:5-(carboxyamino)imidazole ribonucleotide mutase
MGSSSDLEVMRGAIAMLEKLDVLYEERIISAHRTPKAAAEYAESAVERGLEVIIAGAGKAAHLPGVLASLTPLPVIGVPMPTGDLGGMDSLLSIVQMPSGVPVACVAVGGAKNAAILACQILSVAHPECRDKIVALKAELADNVGDKYSALA